MPSHLFFGESTLAPSPVLLSAGIFLFFGLTYTAWDKSERRLSLDNLKDVVLARRGVAHTLVELNKILALTGMAVLPLAYLAFDNAKEHIQLALWGQLVHAAFSTYKYYGDKIPYVSGYPAMISELLETTSKKRRLVGIKRLSVVFGIVSLALLGEPIGAILLAWAFLGEGLTLQQGIGGILILAGVYMVARNEMHKEPQEA